MSEAETAVDKAAEIRTLLEELLEPPTETTPALRAGMKLLPVLASRPALGSGIKLSARLAEHSMMQALEVTVKASLDALDDVMVHTDGWDELATLAYLTGIMHMAVGIATGLSRMSDMFTGSSETMDMMRETIGPERFEEIMKQARAAAEAGG